MDTQNRARHSTTQHNTTTTTTRTRHNARTNSRAIALQEMQVTGRTVRRHPGSILVMDNISEGQQRQTQTHTQTTNVGRWSVVRSFVGRWSLTSFVCLLGQRAALTAACSTLYLQSTLNCNCTHRVITIHVVPFIDTLGQLTLQHCE